MITMIALPTLIIYVAVLGFTMLQLRERARESAEQDMTQLANQLAARFDGAFQEAAAIATTTARFMEIIDPPSLEQIYAQLTAHVQENPAVYGSAMAFEPEDPNSDADLLSPYVYSGPEGIARINIGRDVYNWYRDPAWQWWHLPKKAGHGTWCDPYFDEGAGNVLMVTYSEPFSRQARFAGVTTVDIMLPTLKQRVGGDILGDLDFFIVTRSGTFVFSPKVEDIMKRSIFEVATSMHSPELTALGHRLVSGESGVATIAGWDSDERTMVFFAPIKSTGWSFAARMSERQALAQANSQAAVATGALAITLLLIIGCIGFVSTRLSRPIRKLRAKVNEIAGGNLEARVEGVDTNDEIGDLARSFNQMTSDLRDNIHRLAAEQSTRKKLQEDLELAREIQRGLLPKFKPNIPGFEISGWNLAADQTGGDFFDWLELNDGRTIFTLADVAGHGIGPALIVAVCRAYMRATASAKTVELADAVRRANDLMHADMPVGRFVTAAVGIIDPAESEIALVSAGQAPLLYFEARTQCVHQWDADTIPLGVMPDLEMTPPRVLRMQRDDMLVLVSDGFFEWDTIHGERFGISGLRDFVKRYCSLLPEEFIKRLHDEFVASSGGIAQADDLTALVIRRM